MNPGQPILVAFLFREVTQHLHAMLRSLSAGDWQRPTTSSQRSVKDIASHLLDGSMRRISLQRDGYLAPRDDGERAPQPDTLVAYLNRLNAEWETATRRLSPQVVVEWLAWADEQVCVLFESLDPSAPAVFPVAWAGEEQSCNWMDIAREYTEKWHHTQHIFEAVQQPSTIMSRRLMHPCLDTLMRALPWTYRHVEASPGTCVVVRIAGEAGGDWSIVREAGRWRLATPTATPAAVVSYSADTAWKVATKRRSRDLVLATFDDIAIQGNRELGSHALDMISVMA